MNSNRLHSNIGRVILAFSLLLGIAVVSGSTAQAQWRRDRQADRDQNRGRDDRRDRDRDDRGDRDRNDRRGRNRDRDDRDNGRGGYGRGGYNIYQIAQNQGFQDGLYTGANDAQRGQSYDPQRSHFFRNATYGYDSSYGNREAYKQAYRNGFLQGYREGFQRYGGNRRRNNGRYFPW